MLRDKIQTQLLKSNIGATVQTDLILHKFSFRRKSVCESFCDSIDCLEQIKEHGSETRQIRFFILTH